MDEMHLSFAETVGFRIQLDQNSRLAANSNRWIRLRVKRRTRGQEPGPLCVAMRR